MDSTKDPIKKVYWSMTFNLKFFLQLILPLPQKSVKELQFFKERRRGSRIEQFIWFILFRFIERRWSQHIVETTRCSDLWIPSWDLPPSAKALGPMCETRVLSARMRLGRFMHMLFGKGGRPLISLKTCKQRKEEKFICYYPVKSYLVLMDTWFVRCYGNMQKGFKVLSGCFEWSWECYAIWLSGRRYLMLGDLIFGVLW